MILSKKSYEQLVNEHDQELFSTQTVKAIGSFKTIFSNEKALIF